EPYVKEQTDMPLLVRRDTQKFLRATDLGVQQENADALFYIWDTKNGKPQQVPGCMGSSEHSLHLGALDPALEGEWTIPLADGSRVVVTTVFECLRYVLRNPQYSLESTSQSCGIPEADLKVVFHDFATRKPAMIIHGAGINHWYHNDLMNRAMILIVA